MNIILKRSIVFTFITISLSIFIAIIFPVQQKVVITLISKGDFEYLNSDFINSDNLFIKKYEYFIKTYDQNFKEYKLDGYDQNSSNLDKIVNKMLIEKHIQKIYKNPRSYLEEIITDLSRNKIITKKEQRFFKNSIYVTQIAINPEDGSASQTAGGITYLGREKFDTNEIVELNKMINKRFSQKFDIEYNSELKTAMSSVEKIILPSQLRIFDENIMLFENNIKEFEETNYLDQSASKNMQIINSKSSLFSEKNKKKNMKIDFKDLKDSALILTEKLIFPNIINYKGVKKYILKSSTKEKTFYLLLIFLNIILFMIFIIFFRNGMTHFIKTHIEKH